MSIFKSDISQITQRGAHLFGTATEILFNGEGIYGLTKGDGSNSVFYFNLNARNDKAGVVRVESDDTIYDLRSSINEEFFEKFITLTVYKDAISTSDTEQYTIQARNICFAYDCEMGAIVYIRQGVNLKRIITEESIDDIIAEVMTPWPGGITIIDAFTGTSDDTLLRMRFDDQLDITTIAGDSALSVVLQVLINGVAQDISSSAYFASLGGEYISLYLPTAVVYGDVIRLDYIHNWGGGWGWNDGAGAYLEDFALYPVTNNASEVTTTTTSTSSTSTSTSTTSTSTTSTSSTSTSSTSTSSTSSTSTSTTSTSSTSTTSTSSSTTTTTTTTTLDDEEIWTDGVDTFRFIARNGFACLDQTITATGFSGIEDTDWGNIWEKKVVVTADGTIITVDSTIFLGDNF